MKAISFNTGQDHQEAVAKWARSRLVDGGGAEFTNEPNKAAQKQIGCLFSDGVGLGKTWEALASVAVLLAQREAEGRVKRHKSGRTGRVNDRSRKAHVLIVVPPGLVAKWSGELCNHEGFQRRLAEWAKDKSRYFVTRTLSSDHCYEIRKRDDLKYLPKSVLQRGHYVLPAGTYICNWNVLLGKPVGLSKLGALRRQAWDVVVVDEAHHRQARKALSALHNANYRLLLTATPFQLDMTELHGLTKHLVSGSSHAHKILQHGAVNSYAKAVDAAFEGGAPPLLELREAAQNVLGQLVACSKIGEGRQNRHYFSIDGSGMASQIPPPSELDKESDISLVFDHAISPTEAYQEWYLRMRLGLAKGNAGEKSKHIAVELRKALSIAEGAPCQPKTDALRTWARQQFPKDLSAALNDGAPRKVLIFSHLKKDVVAPVCQMLEEELRRAHRSIKDQPEWRLARSRAAGVLTEILAEIRRSVPEQSSYGRNISKRLIELAEAIRDTLYFDLLGNPVFAASVKHDLLRLFVDEKNSSTFSSKDEDKEADSTAWYSHHAKTKLRAAMAVMDEVAKVRLAATYSGDNTRIERDAVAEAFKTALSPWALVATNVGSEGIDLHRYSLHLVHFDLEWNPARLEQREGRIDRLGRVLEDPARIYFLLVKDTYDERMFHQLVARQRWHGVLLGRKALQLDRDDTMNARWVTRTDAESMSLDLDPRTCGARHHKKTK